MHLIEILDSLDYNLSNIYIIYLNELTDEEVFEELENGLDYLYFSGHQNKLHIDDNDQEYRNKNIIIKIGDDFGRNWRKLII